MRARAIGESLKLHRGSPYCPSAGVVRNVLGPFTEYIAMTVAPLSLTPATSPLWRWAQAAGVALTIVLVAALIVRPAITLHVLWDMVIPILPAVFLVNPLLWRNVCPLATLNAWTGSGFGSRSLGAERATWAWVAGIVLLALLVPARRFFFNVDGLVLAATIVAVVALALAAGFLFNRRAGFCNAVCPVLPVEKLYGQAPLMRVANPRCTDCSLCTPVGCIDLANAKAIPQTVGPARRDIGWVTTPYGSFAAAFPGFIVGYFTVENGNLSTAFLVYTHVAIAALISFALVAVLTLVARLKSRVVFPVLGASAFALYYWFAAPPLAAAYGLAVAGVPVRMAALVLVMVWLVRALRQEVPSLRRS